MPFVFLSTELPGVTIVEPKVFADDRGFFMETYKRSEFVAAGLELDFVQENHSKSAQGTLRGLHGQRAPKAQAKLVRAVHGEVFDVAVDVRRESPTFKKWISVVLSAENRRSVFIPPEYAHGFCVLSREAEVIYKTTAEYAPDLEWGVRWDDPDLAIPWPVTAPRLSERDSRWSWLKDLV
jgi:dTDP-4-dehydrorhamnose 3,5-epimerase